MKLKMNGMQLFSKDMANLNATAQHRNRRLQSRQGGGAASSSKPGPEPVSSAAAAARSEEEPVHMFIDPSNKRVLADLASGKRIAVGNLEARET